MSSVAMKATEVQRTIDAVWRIESAKLIAVLARLTRDVGVAEELAQDALVAALEQWPRTGVPDNPGAWLMAAARNRGIDQLRRRTMADQKHQQLEYEIAATASDFLETEFDDDLLRLIFTACHPVLLPEAQVALTLR